MHFILKIPVRILSLVPRALDRLGKRESKWIRRQTWRAAPLGGCAKMFCRHGAAANRREDSSDPFWDTSLRNKRLQ